MPTIAPTAKPSAHPLVGWDEPDLTRSLRNNMCAPTDAARHRKSKLIGFTTALASSATKFKYGKRMKLCEVEA
jgi:hypothetical protein